MENNFLYKNTNFDIIIIIIILLIAALAILIQNNVLVNKTSDIAMVYDNGKLIRRVELNLNKKINLEEKGMILEVNEGKIRVLKSTCPNKLCVNLGYIEFPGQKIVCIPNKTVIEIPAQGNLKLDAVIY